jgi:CRISPR-associated endonuclease Cas1
MRPQPTSSVAAWPDDLTPPRGVLILSGYGLDVRVWRGRLRVADGIGRDRREALVHRATGRLRRLVVLGHTGAVSLEAVRWLADIGAGYLQLDADGRVLAAFGPQGTDRPGLRRAQARALDTPLGVDIARRLIAEKVAAQAQVLVRSGPAIADATVSAMADASARLHVAVTRDDLRMAEAAAAGAYWSALSGAAVQFARRDVDRIPAHWLALGSRTSPLTGGPRLAGNPANAILNYLYAILEGEATIAARVVGLDPGLGVLHADQQNRDSLAADLMEPVRPVVDRYALELLARRTFAADDFFETRQGVCRITPPLARELALTAPDWGRAVGRVAEDVARLLEAGDASRARWPVATPLSGRNRSRGRGREAAPRGPGPELPVLRGCVECGAPTVGRRRTCGDACEAEARAARDRTPFEGAGVRALAALRAAGVEPVDEAARQRLGARQRERQREENAWNAAHPERADAEVFRREVLPAIQGVPLRELARRAGLSVAYCARIRRGQEVPHARWWEALARAQPLGEIFGVQAELGCREVAVRR